MSSAPGGLTEPQVLAHTKRHLFSGEEEQSYVVADTQFSQSSWLADSEIDEQIRRELAPFNHVRVGTGYPDLVGVGMLEDDLLAVDRLGDEPPLIAVEAKGYTESGGVDVERGVVQAYDRLGEANAVYVTAPATTISQSARTLARELNVGVLGVDADGAVRPVETPRLVGNRTTTETTAIRFQASAQGVADKSFRLNHPKNYLGYPLALYHQGATTDVVADRVVGAIDDAQRGAVFLGLVNETPRGDELTPLGREIVRFALEEYGSVDAALEEFEGWKGRRKRFTDLAPKWGQLARRIIFDYPATQLLVEEIQHMHDDGIRDPSLVDVVEYLHELHPTFTVELFIRGTEDARGRVLEEDGSLVTDTLTDGDVYHSQTVFQLKAMLYHTGLLEERGTESARLEPVEDNWRLRTSVSPR